MEKPCQILRRARMNRKNKPQTASEAPRTDEPAAGEPRHISHHASYTALMRSHDRVRTRHMGVKG